MASAEERPGHDIFISHASEDKDRVARPLAHALRAAGLVVWYDEFSLKAGDSLRESIDRGLADSRFGAVIPSKRFFAKRWPQRELNGLFAKDLAHGKTILPVRHRIRHGEVLRHSPMVADIKALNTRDGLDAVVSGILDVVDPGAAHRTAGGLTLSVSPPHLEFGGADWSSKIPIVVRNRGDRPVYEVAVEITLAGVTTEAVDVEPAAMVTRLHGSVPMSVGAIDVWADSKRLDIIDASGNEAIVIMLARLDPGDARELVLVTPGGRPGSASVAVWAHRNDPAPVQERGGQVGLSVSVPETVRLKAVSPLLSRRF